MGIGALCLMFPDILGEFEQRFTLITDGPVEVHNRGIFTNPRGIEEVGDRILRWLATDDHLAGIRYHPGCHLVADEAFGTKGK